ncbi:hypothetical protein E2C01_042789 [Portunus trituberculatus]|uniref:Uncharacterized protein n=1 Tax=Portunus trituberculatus TaxID=210409 RepID=A0A5B7FR57_PORTR|nr:hypothetical protein [Portunus trituberculatus]
MAAQVTSGEGGRGTPGSLCLQHVWTFDYQMANKLIQTRISHTSRNGQKMTVPLRQAVVNKSSQH